jgi:type VI protein secretion system component VasK
MDGIDRFLHQTLLNMRRHLMVGLDRPAAPGPDLGSTYRRALDLLLLDDTVEQLQEGMSRRFHGIFINFERV